MSRELIMETLEVLPENFEMADFIEALYERIHALQGIKDIENGNERLLEDVIKEFGNESTNIC